MSVKDTVGMWACVVNSAVWTSAGSEPRHLIFGGVWIVFAILIRVLSRETA